MLLLTSSCGGETSEPEPAATTSEASGDDEVAACDLLTDLVALESRTDFEDLDAMRGAAPATSALLTELLEVAPEEIGEDVVVLEGAVADWRRTIEDPTFELDPDTFYIWQTGPSQEASQRLRAWADENCAAGIDAEALRPVTLLVCLPAGSTSDEVQALFARTSTPSETGRGEDLLEGIQGVGAEQQGIAVELDHLITPERKAELIEILRAPPVVEVVEDGACP
ncbi:MAG: hypothetical protein ACT4OV_10755 [Microthrixaceae bacterium]